MFVMWGRTLVFVVLGGCSGQIDTEAGSVDAPPNGGDGQGQTDGGPTPDVPGGVGEPAELTGITLFHNEVRAMVQTATPLPSLTWSPALAATAAAWVAQCRDQDAPIGLVDHNPGRSNGHPYYVGENIYASGGAASAQQAVQLWASEQANYNYATNTCSGVCGHYTQLVWRTTLEVGCAVGNCAGLTYPNAIVCDYGPGGNSGGKPY